MYSPKRRLRRVRVPAFSGVVRETLVLYLDPTFAESYPGTGNTYTDLSVSGNHFTRTAGTFVSGPIKSFSGGTFTRTPNFFGSDATIQAWINTTDVGTGLLHFQLMQIISAEATDVWANPTDFGFGINSSGKLAFGTGASDVTVASTASVNTGTWVNVAMVRVASTGSVRFFINGALDSTGTTAANAGALTKEPTVTLGGGADGSKSWVGNMGSVLAYTSSLTDAQILTNYTAQRTNYRV